MREEVGRRREVLVHSNHVHEPQSLLSIAAAAAVPGTPPRPHCRLDRVGYDVGARVLELLAYRERGARRRPCEVLDVLKHIHSVAWPALFGKTADDLQQANAADDEYMISDADLLVGRFISIPRAYASFVPGSLVAGVVRGMLDAAGFPAR